MTINENMIKLLNKMHLNDNIFPGSSLIRHIPHIDKFIRQYNIKSMLDYGCGKAKHHPPQWNAALYDPGYPPFSEKPTGKYEMVISTDVLEHVEEEYVEEVLTEIFNYATKFVYLNISTRKAGKNLPDGRNAHVTVKPKSWWRKKVKKCSRSSVGYYISFD